MKIKSELVVQDTYSPNRLLDTVMRRLQVSTDAALASKLCVPRSTISKVRHKRVAVTSELLLAVHEITELPIRELRTLMGDTHTRYWLGNLRSYGFSEQAEHHQCADKTPVPNKVLLVDDNADLLSMAALLFEDRGFEVMTASAGAEALQILEQTPDIGTLVSDIVMPGMSGIQLGYKARDLLQQLRVILVSGYRNPCTMAGGSSLEDFEFLSKPYRVDEVIQLIGR